MEIRKRNDKKYVHHASCAMVDSRGAVLWHSYAVWLWRANDSWNEQWWKTKKRVYPDTLDLIYLSDNSLHHQSCFIHHTLFKDKRYDINYKIISDWAHCFQCLIIENRTYRHLPYIISECDGRGISSNGKELNQERTLWFQNTFPATQSKVFIDCAALDRSGFRDIIHILANTHKFKKRMKTLILFLQYFGKFLPEN